MKNKFTPLTESTFLILVSLIEPLHGYGIMQEIHNLSNGRVKMGPGTLYGGLSSLLEKKLIKRIDEDKNENSKSKKLYQISKEGLETLNYELNRLVQLVEIGTKKLSTNENLGGKND